jgi:hypothetical protein
MDEKLFSVEIELSHIQESCLDKALDDLSEYFEKLEEQGVDAEIGIAHEEDY